jgi:hypothetical protein
MQQSSKKNKRLDTPLAPTPVVRWADNVRNPENEEFVVEVAFNKKKGGNVTKMDLKKVTQDEFNQRYGVKKDSIAYLPKKKK